jgi:hypothetical protein
LPWISRVEELLLLADDLRRHALVMFAFQLNWFFAKDPAWTEKNMLSVLIKEGEDQNALWAGFFWAAKVPDQGLYIRLKPYLLRLATQKIISQRRYVEILAGILLAGWGTVDAKTRERFLSSAESVRF